MCIHPPDHTKYVSYQWVTCLRQLLWNQLPLLVVCEKVRMSQQGCVAMPMLIIPYPQGGWWQIKVSDIGRFRASCLHTSLAHELQNTEGVLAVTRETTGAEDRA